MTNKLLYSALIMSLSFAVALDLGLLRFTFAAQSETPNHSKISKSESLLPIVFARFPKSGVVASQQAEDNDRCRQSEAFQSAELLPNNLDICGPKPTATSSKDGPSLKASKWRLPKSPSEFIWQHEVSGDQRLVVELIDSDGLPWPAKFETSRRQDRQSVRIVPSYELVPDREMALVANLYTNDGTRLENWVLPISISQGSNSSLPWANK